MSATPPAEPRTDERTPPRRCSPWWLLLAPIGPVVLLAIDAGLDEGTRLAVLARSLYVIPWLALGLALLAGFRCWRAAAAPGRALRRLWPGALTAVVLVAIVFTLSPPTLRVQFDETSLASVAQNMHAQRLAVMTTGAVPFDGELVRLENTVDKRPPLFAFLVSLLHDLTGPRLANAFVLNAALLGIGLVLVFAGVRARLGLLAAFAAQLLLVAVPLASIVATSGGFELLATVLFAAVLLAALAFVQRPDDAGALGLLALGGLFAQSRYESLPALGVVLVLVLFAVRRRLLLSPGVVGMAIVQSWLVAPLLVLLLYAQDAKFYPEAGSGPLVAWQHLVAHAPPFVAQWLAPALANPLPGLVAIAAALVFVRRLLRRQATWTDVVLIVPVAAVTLMVLLWFYGDVREPTALRLFLPAVWLTAIAPVALATRARPWVAWALLGGALLLAGLRLHEVSRGTTFPRLPNAELAAAVERTAASMPAAADERRHTLWVGTTAQHLIVLGHAALSPQSLLARLQEVGGYARGGHIRTIYVLETPFDAAFAPAFGDVRQVLGMFPHEVVQQAAGEVPITVHRLQLRR